jgi:hypothetical protein
MEPDDRAAGDWMSDGGHDLPDLDDLPGLDNLPGPGDDLPEIPSSGETPTGPLGLPTTGLVADGNLNQPEE